MKEKILNHWNYEEVSAKTVKKPWGKEVWLNYRTNEQIGDEEKKYVLKKLYINKDTKTSFQYHQKKMETNFLIEGTVEAWFETKKGFIEKQILTVGASWTVPPNVKHRIITVDDVILIEASTPEIDDVIRIEDDTMRGDGRIDSEHEINEKNF